MKLLLIAMTLILTSAAFATEATTDCAAINNERNVGSKVKERTGTLKTATTKSY